MTSSLCKQIFQKHSYKEKLKSIIDYDEIIDYLISKNIINETDYLKSWNREGNKLDALFDQLSKKKNNELSEFFVILNHIYGPEFEKVSTEISRDILDDIHLKGGFPKINKYIPRVQEEAKVKGKLGNIRWDNSLVVYGRVGEGKSYLVCECLKDVELNWQYFGNRIYWVNVGECENGSNIMQPLMRLLRMIELKRRKLYNLDDLIDKLQKLFSNKHRNTLVILDNARSLEVIKIFQSLRCKLIIITHFKTVEHAELVEVNSGFTVNETVALFAQYLGTSIDKLNVMFLDDIKELHELCKGHPSTLALLGVILGCKRDHALATRELWNHIKDKIDKGKIDDLGNNDVDIIQQNFYKALKMCIHTIETDEMKELYYQFAVFPKDANISVEVLEVYWGKKRHEVMDIMLHFDNRSLINSFYNTKKKAYIYAIHDLFLYYLKKETEYRKKELHRKLIMTYKRRYEFYNLPDDNYILLFLGYHLKQAEMIEEFKNLLDLRFIEHKILIVGVNNMEQDLIMYADDIINKEQELKKKLEDSLKFIKDNKNELCQLQKTDIIQLALPTLRDDAQSLMARNQANSINKLYFTIKLSAGRLKSSHELILKEVTAMAFCKDSNVSKVLIGLQSGDTLLYCSQTNKEFDRFQGHKKSVFDLKVAHDNSCFLSVSTDHTVKLWQFSSHRLSFDGINNVVSSPKCVQNEYFDAFLNKQKGNNFKEFSFNEDGAYLISANFSHKYSETKRICTGTNNGKIIVWNAHTREKLCMTIETGFPLENIFFSIDDSKILCTKEENIQIYRYGNENLKYLRSIRNLENVVKLFVPNDQTIIAVGLRHVMMYKLHEDTKNDIKVYDSKEYNITCSAVANDAYFAIGINENVLLFDVSNGKLVETLKHNKIVTSMAMDTSIDDDNMTSMILMNFYGNNLQQCNIMMQHYGGEPRNKQGLVTSYWKKKNLPMLALVLNENVLRIQHEFNTINEVEKPHRISFITFSLCGNNIIFAMENGVIMEYQYKKQNCFKTLQELPNAVKYLQCFNLDLPISESPYNSSDTDNGAIIAIADRNIHLLLDGGLSRCFSWDFPIFKVFPLVPKRLLCIDEHKGVVVINISENENQIELILYGEWDTRVTSAAFCDKNYLLGLTIQVHKTNYLEIMDITAKCILKRIHIGFAPTCSTFSYLGNLLVLGGDDGKIMVCNVRTKTLKCNILGDTGVPIKFMQFSNSTLPILVVVGKEVSWWNLSKFETAEENENYSYFNSEFDYTFWENKTIHGEIPHLLQTVSLYSNAVHFSVSKNFETFLVVDDESRIYVMKCFRNIQCD